MSKLLLIRPPVVFAKGCYSVPLTLPISQAYLAANLMKHGHQVQCIDALGEGLGKIRVGHHENVRFRGLSNDEIIARISGTPDAIGITALFSLEWPHIERLIKDLRKHFPDTPIMIGGEHASAASDYVLRTCSDVSIVAIGEGDETIVELASHFDGKKKLEDITGIHFRRVDGTIVKNQRRPRIKSLDELPWPAWQMFNLDPYFEYGEGYGVERGRSMMILATRGCPYTCTFCSSPSMWTTKYNMRDVGSVMDEIESYIKRYRADDIDFVDLTAIIKKEWILAFCAEKERRGLKFTWQLPTGTRSEALDDEVLAAMARNGCTNMTYAPESGSPVTLNRIKKRVDVDRILASIKSAKKHGIFVRCNIVVGFPGETRRELYKTLWFALKLALIGVEDTGLYPFCPYPGSELYEQLRREGRISDMTPEYFESLTAFMNLSQATSYCEHIGPRELGIYRVVGMSVFYALTYLTRPARVWRSIKNYRLHKSDTIFEERLFGIFRRRKLEKLNLAEQSG